MAQGHACSLLAGQPGLVQSLDKAAFADVILTNRGHTHTEIGHLPGTHCQISQVYQQSHGLVVLPGRAKGNQVIHLLPHCGLPARYFVQMFLACCRSFLFLAGPFSDAIAASARSAIEGLNADRDFLRATNVGAETMSDAALQRVAAITKQHVWRNVDGVESEFLSADELENLSIKAGTLTASERKIINQHIVTTIRMLEQLPWPKHLKNVPEYAGGHHERVDGKGYPKGLVRDQMSVQARVMGIADIFEALTATDRPYKVGMKLSQAVSTMNKFKANGHIDPDLFDIFVKKGVYRRYAEQFLDPSQIDEIGS